MSRQIFLCSAAVVFLLFCQTLVFKASDNRMDCKLDKILSTSERSLEVQENVQSFLKASCLNDETLTLIHEKVRLDAKPN